MSGYMEDGPVSVPRAGVSWSSVLAGAVVAVAMAIMLTLLGVGFGFSSASVRPGGNPSAMTFTALAAIWLVVVQWVSSFFGGYLAGRLRPNLTGLHATEVTFRDTAAGLTAWAVAAVVTVTVAGSSITGILKDVGHMSSQTAMHHAGQGAPDAYLLNVLFRPAQVDAQPNGAPSTVFVKRMEAEPILTKAATGSLDAADRSYLVQLVQAQTGVSADEAGQRVDHVVGQEQIAVAKAKQMADVARKSAAELAFYTCFSMMVGAFIAAVAGAVGGRQRDAF